MPTDYSGEVRIARQKWLRVVLRFCGTLALLLGLVGVFLPVLPTVPFLLIASMCFARVSPAYYNWIMNHTIFGPPLREWKRSKSIPLRVKILAISMILVSSTCSILFLLQQLWIKIAVGIICTAVMLFLVRLPNSKNRAM